MALDSKTHKIYLSAAQLALLQKQPQTIRHPRPKIVPGSFSCSGGLNRSSRIPAKSA